MAWPLSQDYNEAIQDPPSAFGDAEFKGGQAVINALGMPMPRSGNFADVYEFQGASGAKWAVKCFTREVPGLRDRYSEISKHLVQAKLPFTVDFQYLDQGIRIRGQWYPVLKMQWVEGQLLNEFVRNNLDKPALLDGLGQIWLRMAKRLRDAGLAHADLQHGNVILVPGTRASSLAVKLIDYDGMFVPALAQKKSGEVGHPAYQHPQRLKQGTYNAEVDRLPLLAVACALRCVASGGKGLWDRYDNGDNLLFREADLRAPAESALFKELWNLPDAAVHDLVGYLTIGLAGPLERAALLPEVAAEDGTKPLSAAQEQQVTAVLGPGARVKRMAPRPKAAIRAGQPRPEAAGADWQALTGGEDAGPTRRRKTNAAASPVMLGIAAACVLAVIGVGGLVFALTRGRGHTKSGPEGGRSTQVAQGKTNRPVTGRSGKTNPAIKPPEDTGKQRPPDDPGPGPGNGKQPPEKEQPPPVVVVAPPGGPSPLDNLDPALIDPADRHEPFGDALVAVLKGYPSEAYTVAFSPDGRCLACGGNSRKQEQICVWDLRRKQLLATDVPAERGSHGVAFLPDDKSLAVGVDSGAQVWDGGGGPPRTLFKDGENVQYRNVVCFDKTLAVTGNAKVLLVDLADPNHRVRDILTGHRSRVATLTVSADGKLLASASFDGTVRMWDLTTEPPTPRGPVGPAPGSPVWSVALSADGQSMAAGCGDGTVHAYLLRDRGAEVQKRWVRKEHLSPGAWVNGLAFAPDGKTFLSTEGSGNPRGPFHAVWWKTGDGTVLRKWRLPERCATVVFSPDGRHVALSCHNHKVYILRLGEKRAAPAEETAQAKYLSDMQEFGVVSERDFGFSKGRFADKQIMIAGVQSPHGLGMHPPAKGFSRVMYRLDKKWNTFRAAVGLNSTAPRDSASPLTFEVQGDGRRLWISQPVQAVRVQQGALADVRGVETLELRVTCPGSNEHAHAVWLEPLVSKEEGPPAVVAAPPPVEEPGMEAAPVAPAPEEGLAAKFVGKYRVTHSGAGKGVSDWVMKANHEGFYQGNKLATWKVQGNHIVMTYDQGHRRYGRTVLWLKGNTWVGDNTHLDGRVFHWVMQRLGPAD